MSSIRITRRYGTPAHDPKVPPPRPLELLSVKEAAHYTKVSTQTLRRAMKAGRLKFYRAGKQIRIDEDDLIQYLSQ
jgi:excisionase family DNA binding protein